MKQNVFGKLPKTLALIMAALFLQSCASLFKYQPYARKVKVFPSRSGVIALKAKHRDEDRKLADSIMAQNCKKKKVIILSEGEVVIGSETKSNTETRKGSGDRKVGKLFGMDMIDSDPDRQSQSSTTVQKKEWQISYRCK